MSEKATIVGSEFICGEIKFAVDLDKKLSPGSPVPPALRKSIDKLDSLKLSEWKQLARNLDLPVEPFDKRLLRPILGREVQNAWYVRVHGVCPQNLLDAQVKHVAFYNQQIELLKQQQAFSDANDATARTPKAEKAEKAGGNVYAFVAAKRKELETDLYGQMYSVVKSLATLETAGGETFKGATVGQIFSGLPILEGIKTPLKPRTGLLLRNLVGDGFLTCVDAAGKKVVFEETEEKPKPAAKKKGKAA